MPRPMLRILALCATALAALAVAAPARAATFTVTTVADAGAGSLRQALTDANASPGADTVAIATTGTIGLQNALPPLSGTLSVTGPGARSLEVRRAAVTAFRIFAIADDATVTMSGLTVSGGRLNPGAGADSDGAGIRVGNRAALTLTDAAVTGNEIVSGDYGQGAGISSSFGRLTLRRTLVAGNSVTGVNRASGGALYAAGNGQVEDVLIEDSTIAGNAVSGTSGAEGGGLVGDGAAAVTVRRSTLAGNAGGNLAAYNGARVSLRSTLLAAPLTGSDDCNVAGVQSLGYNVSAYATCGLVTPTDRTGAALQLGPLGDHGGPTDTIAFARTSAAVDAGVADGATTDQRGLARTADAWDAAGPAGGDGTDAGAYELDLTEGPPQITGIDGDTGVSATDGITADTTLVVRGTSAPLAKVRLTDNGLAVPVAVTAGAGGTWAADLTGTPLAEGHHVLAATATDADGNTSAPSAPLQVVVDTTAPRLTLAPLGATGLALVRFALTADERVGGLSAGAVDLSGSTAPAALRAELVDEGDRWTVDVRGATARDTVAVALPAGAVTDRAGNPSTAVTASVAAAAVLLPPLPGPERIVERVVTVQVPAPPASPAPTPRATPRATTLPGRVATVLRLPSCVRGRRLSVAVRRRAGVRSVELRIAGKRRAAATGPALGRPLVVRRTPAGRFRLEARVTRTDGRVLVQRTTLRACR